MKRALCLSGGGSKGSWMLGVLNTLMGTNGFDYEIMTGVSVGALLVAGLSQKPLGSPIESIDNITSFWMNNVTTENVYKRWFPFGRLHGLWKNSLYDNGPFCRMFRNFFDQQTAIECGRKLAVGAVNLNSGVTRYVTEEHDRFIDYALASSAFPVFFPPVEIDGELWSDGGIKETTPLGQAIKMGADEIDLLVTEPGLIYGKRCDRSKFNAIPDQLLRTVELMTLRMVKREIEITKLKNALSTVDHRYRSVKVRIFIPSVHLIQNSLDFDRGKMREMFDRGIIDGFKFIELK